MHQHPRQSPVSASPANSPRTNPVRTNNPRELETPKPRTDPAGTNMSRDQGIGPGEAAEVSLRAQELTGQSRDSIGKLNQIVQNFFTKAALVILQSRVTLPPAFAKESGSRRVNKWFNVEINETDLTRDDVRSWRSCGSVENRPPPMVIETLIDSQDLTSNQSLVIIDEQGRSCDVEETLSPSDSSGMGGSPNVRPEVIVERWVIQLGEPPKDMPKDLGPILPRTYKNAIVLYRSLYACARLLPAWKYGKRLFNSRPSSTAPKLKYRILQSPRIDPCTKTDHLSVPLINTREDVLQTFTFDPIDSPAGPLSIHVTYRCNCDFRVDDSEALLSSRFMGMDDQYFEPSLGRKQRTTHTDQDSYSRTVEAGSLPQNRGKRKITPDPSQAYGSLSTFHHIGPPASTSPLSALRAARIVGSESPEDAIQRRAPSQMKSAQGSRSSLRSADGSIGGSRRPSVSFMPFKTPSLSASPQQGEPMMGSFPRNSLGKASPLAALAEARAPSALGPYGSLPARGSPILPESNVISSPSNSPKPAPPVRYSSSFGHRKAKLSTGGSSRTEDDNSSGKTSMSSAAQPGSEILAEGGASSGSVQNDDESISDFLKMLDQKKDLKSFRTPNDPAISDASTRRTSAALNKYQKMRDTNRDLSESMSSSLMLQRSSSSSSRQLSSVPAMIAGTSMSASPSPGKPISPHTPHTPTVPSRLSANSIIEYENQLPLGNVDHGSRSLSPGGVVQSSRIARAPTPGAIDIPTSPRPFHSNYRRSSSAAQGPRSTAYDEDTMYLYGTRSASLGVDDRQPVGIDALASHDEPAVHDESVMASGSSGRRKSGYGATCKSKDQEEERVGRQQPAEGREEAEPSVLRGTPYRPRLGGNSGRGDTAPSGSSSSLVERGSGSSSLDQRTRRYSFSRPASTFEDEEPLVFAMSDFTATQQSRRSLEEARGSSSGDRGGGDAGMSMRRGNRRGGY